MSSEERKSCNLPSKLRKEGESLILNLGRRGCANVMKVFAEEQNGSYAAMATAASNAATRRDGLFNPMDNRLVDMAMQATSPF